MTVGAWQRDGANAAFCLSFLPGMDNRAWQQTQRLDRFLASSRLGSMAMPNESVLALAQCALSIGARRYLEVGCFVGRTALAMAAALGPRCRATVLETRLDALRLAQSAWRDAGVADRILPIAGPAMATIDAWLRNGAADCFDVILLDADKEPVVDYARKCWRLLAPGGVLAVDNALLGGRTVDAYEAMEKRGGPFVAGLGLEGRQSNPPFAPAAVEMARFLRWAKARFDAVSVLLPAGDGLCFCRKGKPA